MARCKNESHLSGLLHLQTERVNTNTEQDSLHMPLSRRAQLSPNVESADVSILLGLLS